MDKCQNDFDEKFHTTRTLKESKNADFYQDKDKLTFAEMDHKERHSEEQNDLITAKEKNLTYVLNSNDEIEAKISRQRKTMASEIYTIEEQHKRGVKELTSNYDESMKKTQTEVQKTIQKLKDNAKYY
jgi:hypothetical protein